MTDAIKKTGKLKVDKVGPIASKRFKNAAIRKRGGKQPSVPIKTVSGLKDANKESQSKLNKEQTDLFDVILEHLVAEGYADTNEAALAIMANMSEDWREDIVEKTAMAKRGHDETAIRNKIAKSTGGGEAADRAGELADRKTFGHGNSQARNNLARSQKGDFRNTTSSSPGLHGYWYKSDDSDVKAKQAARGAQRGALTPKEKKQFGR